MAKKSKKKNRVLYIGVDIGARNLGVAILSPKSLRKITNPDRYVRGTVCAASCLTVSAKEHAETLDAAKALCENLDEWLRQKIGSIAIRHYNCSKNLIDVRIAIEFPVARLGDIVGRASTGGGDTIALGYAAGLVDGYSSDYASECLLVTPQQWKGQLPKRITEHRMRKVLEPTDSYSNKIRSHAWDAVGLALYSAGVFINDKSMTLS